MFAISLQFSLLLLPSFLPAFSIFLSFPFAFPFPFSSSCFFLFPFFFLHFSFHSHFLSISLPFLPSSSFLPSFLLPLFSLFFFLSFLFCPYLSWWADWLAPGGCRHGGTFSLSPLFILVGRSDQLPFPSKVATV